MRKTGELVAATWGQKPDGTIGRVHMVKSSEQPHGMFDGEPVVVQFVEETEATAILDTPGLEAVRESWAPFTPLGDFQIPLPPLVQE